MSKFLNQHQTKLNTIGFILKVAALGIVFVLLLSVSLYVNERDALAENFYDAGEVLTSNIENALLVWINEQVRLCRVIANNEKIIYALQHPDDPEAIEEAEGFLSELQKQYDYMENIPVALISDNPVEREALGSRVIIESGDFLMDSYGGLIAGKGGAHLSYINAIMEGKRSYIGEVYKSITLGNPIFVISLPIEVDEQLIGIAVLAPRLDYFTKKFVEPTTIGETGYLFFLDARGVVIAHPEEEYFFKEAKGISPSAERIVNRIISGETRFEDEYEGKAKHYYSKKVNIPSENIRYDWYITLTQEDVEIFSATKGSLRNSVFSIIYMSIFLVATLATIIQLDNESKFESQLIRINRNLENKVRERTAELQMLADHDGLTRLFNHRKVLEKAAVSQTEAVLGTGLLSIVMLDIDYFKKVNDTFGHQVGDSVIMAIASILKEEVDGSGYVGRYGGEEFMLVLSDLQPEDVSAMAQRIRIRIMETKFDNIDYQLTASLGIAHWRMNDINEVISEADRKLYEAKHTGRNRVVE